MVRKATQPEEATLGKPKGAKPTGRVNSYDAEMAALAAQQQTAEAKSAGGTFISTKGGKFSIGGNVVRDGKIRCVVIDSIFLNTFYSGPYNPDVATSPECYAIATADEDLAPHEECEAPQHEKCAGCPMNAFGTATTGTGKACKNQRRLALILEDDLEDPAAPIYMLNVAPTSTKPWATFVQQVVGATKKPLIASLTEIEIYIPQGKTYAMLAFAHDRLLEQAEIANVFPRRAEAMTSLTAPYPKNEEREEAPKRGRAAKPAAKAAPNAKFRRK